MAMVGSGGKFLKLRSPDAWTLVFLNHSLYIKYKKLGYLVFEV